MRLGKKIDDTLGIDADANADAKKTDPTMYLE
jgi:hypothetical protein